MTDTATQRAPGTRERIVEAALRLIGDQGISTVTMKSIAEGAGVARQTLYNHFPDVDAIIAESIATHQVAGLSALRTLLAAIESPIEQLEHLVRHSAALAVLHGPALSIEHGLSSDVRAVVRKHDAELVAMIRDTLQTGVAEGALRADVDLDRDPVVIKRMLDAAAELAVNEPESLQTTVAAATRTTLAAVAAPAG